MVKLAPQVPIHVSQCTLPEMSEEWQLSQEKDNDDIEKTESDQGLGLTPALALIAAVGTLGNSLPTGYNLGVVNMPQEILKSFVNATWVDRGVVLSPDGLESVWSVVVSAFLAGAIIGSLCAGYLANKIGRRGALFVNCLVGLMSSVLFALSHLMFSVEILILARILAGMSGGLGSSVAPLYLMETAPVSLRGAFGVMQQLGLTTGILLSQVLGLREFLGTPELWPVLLSLYGAGMLFGLVALPFCPNSPSFLYVNRQKDEQAFKELERLRGIPLCHLSEEIMLLKKERKLAEMSAEWTLFKLVRSRQTRTALLLICGLHAAQQLSGISAVFYYSTSTFAKAGMNEQQVEYGSIGAGVANAFMACLAVPLVNSVRRRKLLAISCTASLCCLVGLTISMATQHLAPWIPVMTVSLVLAFVLVFGLGLGPLPFMLGSELLSQGPRAAGMGIGSLVNWTANFIVAIVFPYLENCFGEFVFLGFAIVTAVLFIFLMLQLPETKGLDSTQVTLLLQRKIPIQPNEAEDQNFVTAV